MTSNKQPTLNDILKYGTLIRNITAHRQLEKTLPPRTIPVLSPDELVGIEIEMENIRNPFNPEYYWKYKQDGSLRNKGAEFASIPLMGNQIEYALKYLKHNLEVYQNEPNFSSRTSVHVHLNVRDMTWEEVRALVILYCIFERHFFLQTKKEREQSIFCVPLYKTNYIEKFTPTLEDFNCYRWSKYCALNLIPIFGDGNTPKYGTIEFRHLHGTLDPEVIINWINNIYALKKAAQQLSVDELINKIRTMNTTSSYMELYTQIFTNMQQFDKVSKKDFEYCISILKLGLFKQELRNQFGLDLQKGKAYSNLYLNNNNNKVHIDLNGIQLDLNEF